MRTSLSAAVAALLLFNGCSDPSVTPAQIQWDTWGVPHITAATEEDLFFAQGWAQMRNHANLILDLYGSARGKGAEYWGPDKLGNDLLIRTMGFDGLADQWGQEQDPMTQTIFNSFVDGMNAYAAAHPDVIDPRFKDILPLTTKDLNMHAMYIVFTLFIGGNDLGRIQQWPDMGSNTYAVGPSRSASGNAMLVQNPHLPWWREFLFFESQLTLRGKPMYGATLVGFPGIAIGFNENLGWSHTDNTIDNADTYELEVRDGGYVLDGERREFETRTDTLRIRQEDGTVTDSVVTFRRTEHGPVVNGTADKVLALRLVGLDRPDMFLQWWRMITSENFDQFESALKMAQIPFWNVMYADRDKNIFYLFNGLVPKRSTGDWAYWDRIIPDGNSSDIWTEVHPYSDLPKLKNPATGWLQNSNDPPWTSTLPTALNPEDFPAYMAPRYMSFRPQRSAHMFSADSSVTYSELIDYKLSTRSELADRLLDDLFAAVDASESQKAKEAKAVLEAWDREADSDSKGTVLFFTWVEKFQYWRTANYATPWNFETPDSTPDGLADPQRAVQLLETSADEVLARFGRLDVPWGEFYRITYAGKDLPGNGSDGSLGVVRVAWPGDGDATHMYIGGGDSWVGIIEFGEGPKARVLLSYGNATQPESPHFGDQLELFSRKDLRDAWFTPEALEGHIEKTEVRSGNGFVDNP